MPTQTAASAPDRLAGSVRLFSGPPEGPAIIAPVAATTVVTFVISYEHTVGGQDLYVVGNAAELGDWDPARAIRMSSAAWPRWTVTLALASGRAVQYKHLRKDAAGTVLWEADPNHCFTPTGAAMTRTDTWH